MKQKPTTASIKTCAAAVKSQCDAQVAKFGGFYSLHEAMAKMREEFEEVWEICKQKEADRDPVELRKEALQIAACAIEIAALADDQRITSHDPVPWIRR